MDCFHCGFEHFNVPCPECSSEHVIEVAVEEDDGRDVALQCRVCGHSFEKNETEEWYNLTEKTAEQSALEHEITITLKGMEISIVMGGLEAIAASDNERAAKLLQKIDSLLKESLFN